MVSDNSVGRDARSPLLFRDRPRTIAKLRYDGWIAPPAALFGHVCIDGPRDQP